MTGSKKRDASRARTNKRGGRQTSVSKTLARRCGLCAKSGKLMRTGCCGQWICDDEDTYVMFSYAQNSCSRNHRRYTLCGYHYAEEHNGDWRECLECREEFETEMYVYYGTNDYNFLKLENPPSFEPTRCKQCRTVIRLAEDGCTMKGKNYYCERCSSVPW